MLGCVVSFGGGSLGARSSLLLSRPVSATTLDESLKDVPHYASKVVSFDRQVGTCFFVRPLPEPRRQGDRHTQQEAFWPHPQIGRSRVLSPHFPVPVLAMALALLAAITLLISMSRAHMAAKMARHHERSVTFRAFERLLERWIPPSPTVRAKPTRSWAPGR